MNSTLARGNGCPSIKTTPVTSTTGGGALEQPAAKSAVNPMHAIDSRTNDIDSRSRSRGADGFATLPSGKRLQELQIAIVSERNKAHRAVAQGEVGATRVRATEGAHAIVFIEVRRANGGPRRQREVN